MTIDGQIVVSGLTKQYKRVRAVDDLSFTVEPGRVTGFLGPNGAGKTTTLRMLLNLVTPMAGTATIGGYRYADLPDPLRTCGAVLEASSAHKGRTGRNHLRVICAAAGFPQHRADEVLQLVGLGQAGTRKFKTYSMGMRQRIGIAAAMLGDPRVLILDEPANGLDPEGIRWMLELLADDIVIIAAGRLVTQGTVDGVLRSMPTQARVRVRTPDSEKLTAALTEAGATVTTNGAGALYITGIEAPAVGAASLRAGVELHELMTE